MRCRGFVFARSHRASQDARLSTGDSDGDPWNAGRPRSPDCFAGEPDAPPGRGKTHKAEAASQRARSLGQTAPRKSACGVRSADQSPIFGLGRAVRLTGDPLHSLAVLDRDFPSPVGNQPRSRSAFSATVTPGRRTPSMSDRNSWVSGRMSLWSRSCAIRSQRASRSSSLDRALQIAV
jgi:hypothetical protein